MCLQELRILADHLYMWGVPYDKVLLDPLMAPYADYYTSTMFQVHLVAPVAGAGLALQSAGIAEQVLSL